MSARPKADLDNVRPDVRHEARKGLPRAGALTPAECAIGPGVSLLGPFFELTCQCWRGRVACTLHGRAGHLSPGVASRSSGLFCCAALTWAGAKSQIFGGGRSVDASFCRAGGGGAASGGSACSATADRALLSERDRLAGPGAGRALTRRRRGLNRSSACRSPAMPRREPLLIAAAMRLARAREIVANQRALIAN